MEKWIKLSVPQEISELIKIASAMKKKSVSAMFREYAQVLCKEARETLTKSYSSGK